MNGELSRVERNLLERTSARQAAENAVSLEVTLLGDGSETQEFTKRLELQERLTSNRFVRTVTIPEELQENHPEATADEVERSAIEEADVVLCLEAPTGAPLGLYTEVWSYFDHSATEKWYRLCPAKRPESAGEGALIAGLASDLLSVIETHTYDPEEWSECSRITALCEQRIELVARRVLHQRMSD